MKKEISNKERMQQLVRSFEQKNEIIKEETENIVDESAILKEAERLKTIARVDEWVNMKPNKHLPNHGGVGTTVNTFIPSNEMVQTENPKTYNPEFTFLQPSEALLLAIRRVLESGAPVNNIGLYDEINWNLNNMGFNARMPIDIKNAIRKLIAGE